MEGEPRQAPEMVDRPRIFAGFSMLSAVLSAGMLVAAVQPAPPDPAARLAYVAAHEGRIGLEAVMALAWAVFSIPFVVALGWLLRVKSPALASAATLLSAGGLLLLGYSLRMSTGAQLAVIAAGGALGADALREATVWWNLSFFLTDPGLMIWGLGQFLFGWLAWKSEVLPNWVAIAGLLGGAAGLLTDAVYQTPVLALIQLASFALWGGATAALLFRRPGAVQVRR
jgi:Domain of unknown function (DUF4386)